MKKFIFAFALAVALLAGSQNSAQAGTYGISFGLSLSVSTTCTPNYCPPSYCPPAPYFAPAYPYAYYAPAPYYGY